jgi:hypothetical protein
MTLEQIALIGPLINIKRSSLGDVHFWLKFHGHETELRTNRSFFFPNSPPDAVRGQRPCPRHNGRNTWVGIAIGTSQQHSSNHQDEIH